MSAAEDGSPAEGIDLVLFQAGGWRLAAPAAQLQASRSPTPGEVPPTLEALLGLPAVPRDRQRQLLQLKHGEGRELEVSGPLQLLHAPPQQLHPLPALLAARSRLPGLRALLTLPGEAPLAVLDLSQLPASS